MRYFFLILCLVGVVVVAILLLRRLSQQHRQTYLARREAQDKRLTQQFIEGLDEETRKEYLKDHGQDVS